MNFNNNTNHNSTLYIPLAENNPFIYKSKFPKGAFYIICGSLFGLLVLTCVVLLHVQNYISSKIAYISSNQKDNFQGSSSATTTELLIFDYYLNSMNLLSTKSKSNLDPKELNESTSDIERIDDSRQNATTFSDGEYIDENEIGFEIKKDNNIQYENFKTANDITKQSVFKSPELNQASLNSSLLKSSNLKNEDNKINNNYIDRHFTTPMTIKPPILSANNVFEFDSKFGNHANPNGLMIPGRITAISMPQPKINNTNNTSPNVNSPQSRNIHNNNTSNLKGYEKVNLNNLNKNSSSSQSIKDIKPVDLLNEVLNYKE
ncbi:hypothetical protein ACO0SA_001466 [Hanseniaspora valbyensis]